MPATNAGSLIPDARLLHNQQIHYVRRNLSFAQNGQTLSIGKLPAGSLIVKQISGITVNEAFNAGTTNTADIGTSGTPTQFGSALSTAAIAAVPIAQAVSEYLPQDTEIFVRLNTAGTTATTGKLAAVIAYIPNNDLGQDIV